MLSAPPPVPTVRTTRRITDRYLTGTRLRLRRVQHMDSGDWQYKLTQKLPADQPGPVQGLITNMYLNRTEYDLLSALPAAVLTKTRLSVPPLGIDVFDGHLHGLIIAEAEFTTDATAHAFAVPRLHRSTRAIRVADRARHHVRPHPHRARMNPSTGLDCCLRVECDDRPGELSAARRYSGTGAEIPVG